MRQQVSWLETEFCKKQRATGRWRSLRTTGPTMLGVTEIAGRALINFSSNNYLGLASHPLLIQRAQRWAEQWGVGSTASRLVCGNLEIFEQIERKLALGKGSEAALVLNSGFQANAALLPTLLDRKVLNASPLVFSDRLNHASIHHGCRAAGVRQIRYQHNDMNHLESLLKKKSALSGQRFILSETVFSMDGDRADLDGLITLKNRYGAFLYLDEAHATGVLGPHGFGISTDFPDEIDCVMGTFSKALGSFGGYVACSEDLKQYLIQRADGFIYTTALPPPVLGAIDAALDLLPTWEMHVARRKLQRRAACVRRHFQNAGLNTGRSSTQIIPVMVGKERDVIQVAGTLEEAGILSVAIRPPTVPEGTSRLRFSLTAAHTEDDLRKLMEAVSMFTIDPNKR